MDIYADQPLCVSASTDGTESHMRRERPQGLFVVGTDTGVGKTYVSACLLAQLHASGHRVGAYKPVASGCHQEGEQLVSEDAITLWNAIGRTLPLDRVCPQRFHAPLAPYLAAEAEGRKVDPVLLRTGLQGWEQECELLVVEGAGGLLSPLHESTLVADLALEFGYPLLVVAANRIGVIHHVLQTCLVAEKIYGLTVQAVILNSHQPANLDHDPSTESNLQALRTHCKLPVYPMDYQQTKLFIDGGPANLFGSAASNNAGA